MNKTIAELRHDLRETNGYISFNIETLENEGYLPDNFDMDSNSANVSFGTNRHLYINDMDEMKPHIMELRADFRSTSTPDVVDKLVKSHGVNLESWSDEINGATKESELHHNGKERWKYGINCNFQYYPGIHQKLVDDIYKLDDFDVNQIWWFDALNEDDPHVKVFGTVYDALSRAFYPEWNVDKIEHQMHQTYYPKGGMIEDHNDGTNNSNIFAGLIYLNNRYDESWGGRLRTGIKNFGGECETLSEPRFGNISMLDFKKFNTAHGVEKMINENGRYALLSFTRHKDPNEFL
jgi:Rps23 Pro-64 3,4-dihydroxylase Tpa1-like proline 4-hydroxylase|tara:strand:- start:143 stop:1021 length:879 start_codon:yes stop_codon:yes gene_type:complete